MLETTLVVKLLNKLRSRIGGALNPLASAIARSGISPNAITLMGFLVCLASAYLFYTAEPLWGGMALLLSGFDIIDGAVARASGKVSRWGGVLDSTLDRYSDLAVLAAILLAGLCDPIAGAAALIGSVMVSYVRAKGELESVKMSSVGLMERAERIVVLAAAAVAGYTWAGVIVLAVLTQFTVLQRLYHIWKSLRAAPQ
ncbi:MAG TPA: archaetidylinositol phosphate synthase [Candidatus Methanomethylicus sp.]|nr:archaetidylinositol phosphate synthase [Candidatus Methanomethylicus sp.]